MIVYGSDSQSFSLSAIDMHGVELTALDMLQQRLARNAEDFGRILHRHVALGWVFDETAGQIIRDPEAPSGARDQRCLHRCVSGPGASVGDGRRAR